MKANITIGGSMIAAVLGVSEYTTSREAWEILMGMKQNDPNQYALIRGRIAEEFIEKLSCELWGFDIIDHQVEVTHGIGHGTIDAVGYAEELSLFEYKSSNKSIDEYESIPLQYRLQVQWYLGLWNKVNPRITIKKAYLIFMDGYFNLKKFEIPFNQELFDAIYQTAEEWHQKYIVGNTPPPEVDADILKRINDIEPNGVIELPSEMYPLLEQLESVKDQITVLEVKKKELEDKIKIQMKDVEEGYLGNIKISFKIQSRESVDAKLLKIKYPQIYEELKKESKFRVLRINFKNK